MGRTLLNKLEFSAKREIGHSGRNNSPFEGDRQLNSRAGPIFADVGGTAGTAGTITSGQSVDGAIEVSNDHDWFAITLTAGQAYTFKTAASSAGGTSVDTTLTLRSSSGTVISSNDDANGGLFSQITYTPTTSGTFYIDVGAYSTRTGNYSLTVSGGGGTSLPVYTNDQIANQLTNGYWAFNGQNRRAFNVSPGGTLTVNVTQLTAAGQNLARQALALWTDVTGIAFSEVTTGGSIRFDDNQSGAYATSTVSGNTITRSNVNVGLDWLNNYGTGLNSYSFQTYVHEIGHAIGLGHAGNYNGSANYPDDAQYANDGWPATVMSYFTQTENTYFSGQGFTQQFVVTPMAADGVAVNALYGTPTTTRTGNTVYGFNNTSGRAIYDASANPSVSYTIFDNGGVDTLDYSGFSATQRIDLTPEAFSNVGGRVGNVVIARGVTIENAIGGSGSDTIVGNAAANNLQGGGGGDTLIGGGGGDTLTGGSGNDVFRGTASQLAGDTVTDIAIGDRIHITDGVLNNISVSGSTLNLGGGQTLTITNGSGRSFTVNAASDGGVNVAVSGTGAQAMGADLAIFESANENMPSPSRAAPSASSAGLAQADRTDLMLLRMTQDMAAFGARGGEMSGLGSRLSEHRYEYFAAA